MLPTGPRPTARPGPGPGRGRSRTRTQPRERDAATDPANEPTVALGTAGPSAGPRPTTSTDRAGRTGVRSGSHAATPGTTAPGTRPAATRRRSRTGRRALSKVLHRALRANLTARALALVVVVLVLTISYATSLRIYFSQAHDIASTKAEIASSQAAIADLQGQIARWNDPAYVAAQARERLGWLVPGETGYTVVGPDGKPLGGGLTLDSSAGPDPEHRQMWWDRMWGSVAAADRPAPVTADPASRPPVTAQSKPR